MNTWYIFAPPTTKNKKTKNTHTRTNPKLSYKSIANTMIIQRQCCMVPWLTARLCHIIHHVIWFCENKMCIIMPPNRQVNQNWNGRRDSYESSQFHSVLEAACPLSPSFTKVIQIRPPAFGWTASVCVFGHHKAISGFYSRPHFCLTSRCDCVRLVLGELLKVTAGSRSQRDFKVEWRRVERISTSHSPEPLLQQPVCLQVITSVMSLSRDPFLINIPNCSQCLSFFHFFQTYCLPRPILNLEAVILHGLVQHHEVFTESDTQRLFQENLTFPQCLLQNNHPPDRNTPPPICVTVSLFVRLSRLSVSQGIT